MGKGPSLFWIFRFWFSLDIRILSFGFAHSDFWSSIMTQPASMGSQARLSMAAPGTAIAAYSESFEFASESLAKKLTILDTAGIPRPRPHPAQRTRDGTHTRPGAPPVHCSQ